MSKVNSPAHHRATGQIKAKQADSTRTMSCKVSREDENNEVQSKQTGRQSRATKQADKKRSMSCFL
eukprot:6214322-Pleurochrysis_carterae.AAC.2